MILIVGATGLVGTEVARLLASAGKPVRALVRGTSDPAKVQALSHRGATVVQGDLRDPASLERACEGVEAVLATASALPFAYEVGKNTPQDVDQDGYLGLLAAARASGVRQFVYTSFPPMPASFPLQTAKRAVEAALRSSGLTYTILQPTYFAEIWLSPAVGFDPLNRKATIYGNGDNPISWISYRDVATFAVASIDNPAARNATLPLGGPEGITPAGVVRIFEQIGGTPFDVTYVPTDALHGQLEAATDPMQRSFAGLMLGYAHAQPIDMAGTLRAFPMALRTVADHARSVLS